MVEKSTKAPRRSTRKREGGDAARPARSAGPEERTAEAAPAGEWTAYVAVNAYYRAERRGFAPGREIDDWLAAEAELEATRKAAPARRAPSKPRKPTAAA
jgi:hypothetical protein